jgi:hypothetical protein
MTSIQRGLVAALIAVVLASCSPTQVKQSGAVRGQSAPFSFTDPDDVNLPLGKVEDTKEKELGAATVTRISSHGLRVSFSRRIIGVASYQYQVIAVNDTNGNDEDDPGETDNAPDTGFQPHRL